MIATKEQERKALEQIRKIVEGLGENSYIGMAFEGCFEIAEENIENDFGCSMKQRVEKAQKDAEYFKRAAETFSKEADELRKERDALKAKTLTVQEVCAIKMYLAQMKLNSKIVGDEAAEKIVELAENPQSADFRQAVEDNRAARRMEANCEMLIARLIETMKA